MDNKKRIVRNGVDVHTGQIHRVELYEPWDNCNVRDVYVALCNRVINIVDDCDKHTLVDALGSMPTLRETMHDISNIVDAWLIIDGVVQRMDETIG